MLRVEHFRNARQNELTFDHEKLTRTQAGFLG
jgi:hypothetical protein